MSLNSLNQTGLQIKDPPLYQTLNDLIQSIDRLQKQVDSYKLGIDINGGLDTILNPFNLLNGQIKFPSTNNPSIDPNTLDDYEENSTVNAWTPVDNSGAGLVFTKIRFTYVKIGCMVFATFAMQYPGTASGLNASISGLPFVAEPAGGSNIWGGIMFFTNLNLAINVNVQANTPNFFFTNLAGAQYTNAQLTGVFLVGLIIYRTDQ